MCSTWDAISSSFSNPLRYSVTEETSCQLAGGLLALRSMISLSCCLPVKSYELYFLEMYKLYLCVLLIHCSLVTSFEKKEEENNRHEIRDRDDEGGGYSRRLHSCKRINWDSGVTWRTKGKQFVSLSFFPSSIDNLLCPKSLCILNIMNFFTVLFILVFGLLCSCMFCTLIRFSVFSVFSLLLFPSVLVFLSRLPSM